MTCAWYVVENTILAGARKTNVLMPTLLKAWYRLLNLLREYSVLRITSIAMNRLRRWVTALTVETAETGLQKRRLLVTRLTAWDWREVSVWVEPSGWHLSRLTVPRIPLWAVLEMLGERPTMCEIARRSILVSPVILNTEGCPPFVPCPFVTFCCSLYIIAGMPVHRICNPSQCQ